VSVVVPLYNERAGVAQLTDQLVPFLTDWRKTRRLELVLVDDGSEDGTAEALSSLAAAWVKIRRHESNRGLTAALETGLTESEGGIVCWLDSDLSYEPEILLHLVERVDAGADVAMTSPHHPEGRIEGVPFLRRVLSRGLSRLYRTFVDRDIYTYTGMVRAYRREVLESCRPDRGGFLGVTEVLLRALAKGRRVVEVPAVLRARRSGASKLPVIRTAARHLALLATAWLGSLSRDARGQSARRSGR
jgi:dolichol-phosphate mannosyltransferase